MFCLVGKKLGMSRIYDEKGVVTPVTLVQLYETIVSDFIVNEEKDFNSLTISYDKPNNPEKKLSKAVLGIYKKKNLEPYKKMKTIKVKKEDQYNVGELLGIDLFDLGDEVSVTGISKGKGFAGGMKRWGFHGACATHGVSRTHRAIGSTGTRHPNVYKGRKMPGHLGNEQVTVKNLKVVDLDKDNHIICVKGGIPGSTGSDVVVKKASKKQEAK